MIPTETPADRKYSKHHSWAKVEKSTVKVGITAFAQERLTDIVFVELPTIGTKVKVDEPVCTVESVKAVSEVHSPVEGTITDINHKLEDAPELLNDDSYTNWIVQIEIESDNKDLLNAKEYDEFTR